MVLASKKSDYTGQSIKVLEGLEPVRKRPAMYIGTTSIEGVYHCLAEIVDNAIDEALAGFAKNIFIRLEEKGYITVIDDGRGIPTDKVPGYNISALELVMTKLHAGGKFDGETYKVSGGLHGVGASCVNALSDHLIAEIKRDGKVYRQEYKRGVPQYTVKEVKESQLGITSESATAISWVPDKSIFNQGIELLLKSVQKRIKDRAYLIPSVMFTIHDIKEDRKVGYYFDGGILSLLKDLNRNKEVLHDALYCKTQSGQIELEVALQYNDGVAENVHTFVNVINTKEGGTHLTGFKTSITRSINAYAKKEGFIKDGGSLSGDDVREGLTAIIYIKMPSSDLQFEGQTKTKLGNPEIQGIVQQD